MPEGVGTRCAWTCWVLPDSSLAGRAPAVRRIEGEKARFEFIKRAAGAGTKELRAIDGFLSTRVEDVERAAAKSERGVDQLAAIRRGELFAEAAEFDADGVFDVAIKRLEFRGLDPFAVDAESARVQTR